MSSYVAWMQLSGTYGEYNGVESNNKAYSHIRYIHSLFNQNITYEMYGQLQYDKFKLIKNRTLLGSGLRYKKCGFFVKDSDKIFIGVGAFNEYIKYLESENIATEHNIRANLYIAYVLNFMDKNELSYLLYFQPIVNNNANYAITNAFQLKVQLYENLYLNININYSNDTTVPDSVNNENFSQVTSLSYDF